MKKFQILSLYALSFVVVFFLIFLHPVFLVRFFTNKFAYIFFRILSGITSLVGIAGIIIYGYIFHKAIKTKQLNKPILWLQLSLATICITMLFGFLIPITISP